MSSAARSTPMTWLTPWNVAGSFVVGGLSVWLVLLAALALVVGAPYYLTAHAARPDHPLHDWFRPGAGIGLLLAVVGTSLMLVMLLYSVRKVLGTVEVLGPPTWWLRFHMVCGIMGPVFIVMHSGFEVVPTGIVSIGYWCMILVSVSGIFGRYLFGHFPAAAASRRLDLQFAEQRLGELRATLVAETSEAEAERIGEALRLVRDLHDEPRTLLGLLLLDIEVSRRAELVRLHLHKAKLSPKVRRRIANLLVGQLHTKKSIASWEVARRLFRYWHLFHQPLALAMYGIAGWHILTAIAFGGVLGFGAGP